MPFMNTLIFKRLMAGIVLATGFIFVTCQHDDDVVTPVINDNPPPPIQRGDEKLSCSSCTPLLADGAKADFDASGVPSDAWYFDKAHSNVQWETQYKAVGALLTGRFNYFVLTDLNFDEQNPSQISFQAYVRLNSVNTGEPGRDGSCLLGTYGTAAGKTVEPENIASLTSVGAVFSPTDAGYIVRANLTFLGVTKEVTGKMHYVKQQVDGAGKICGLMFEFPFLSKTDYGLVSNNVADNVVVKINATLKRKS
jgi:polyisoprenoid-binding protein YceI